MKTVDDNNEIERGGRVERYELVDGYLEVFVGYVHRAESPLELAYQELLATLAWFDKGHDR